VGAAVGLGGAVAVARLAEPFLIGVGSMDPASLMLPLALLVLSAFAASYIPARRAMRLDPTTALRQE
jgi:putative ABC transport system permease protein